MPFSLNWGKFQTNLPPPITSCPLHFFLPGASEEKKREGEEGEEKKKNGLVDDLKTNPHGRSLCGDTRPDYQIFTKKAAPDRCAGGVW